MVRHQTILVATTILLTMVGGCSGERQNKSNKEKIVKCSTGIIELDIRNCEKLIPNSLFDTNHIVIWREGSIFFSEYLSCLIIEKKQLKDDQLLCYYMTFDPGKPSNYRNWKFADVYELTLENIPFKFPLKNRVTFNEIDSLAFECQCEGIEANVYFLKEFHSDLVYPVHPKHNSSRIRNIEHLFKQVSKREHAQTFSLVRDTINYGEIRSIINADETNYCIKDNKEAGSLQRRWGDK